MNLECTESRASNYNFNALKPRKVHKGQTCAKSKSENESSNNDIKKKVQRLPYLKAQPAAAEYSY